VSDIQHNINALMHLRLREEQAMSALSNRKVSFTHKLECDTLTSVIEFICTDNPQATESLAQYINTKARQVAQIEARTKRNV